MMGLRHLSVRRRILLVGAVPAILAVLILTAYHMQNRWSDLRRENESIAKIVLEQISASAEYPLISGNYDLLKPLVHAALDQPAIVEVEITDTAGQSVVKERSRLYEGHQDVSVIDQPIVRLVPQLDEFSEFADTRLVERNLGSIRLTLSDAYTREREQQILQQSLLTGLAVVILAALVSRAASLSILTPLEKLAAFIAGLAAGATRTRLTVDDGAEIGHLQVNANRLAESLEKAERDQQTYTEQLMLEQQRTQHASRAKSEFLAMMSHELRTPLNGAIGMLQLLDPANSAEEFDDYKRTADRSLTHLTQLLEDVLVVVDTEKNKLPVTFSEQKLPEVLDTLLQTFSARALEKSLSFVTEYDDALRNQNLRCDPSLVRQVVRHLVDNAIKFTDDGMVSLKLSMQASADGSVLSIRVTDTGIGIAAGHKEKVLEAFSQANSSFSRRHEGVGLGLTISHHICRMLGGDLALQDAPGRGTDVMASIPAQLVMVQTDPDDCLGSGYAALIVEDNPVNLKVTEKMLSKAGCCLTVESVMSGEDCLERLRIRSYDLILMDCQMPGLDGFETTRRLREMGVGTPVVACTANTTDNIRERCLASGMNDYLAKPLTLALVRDALSRWLPEEQKSPH
ncbi:response regulator [Thalassolituus sp. LLYu03]|uniref:response regulator n=1 Tax=Thalassolituus sp. LLYu03 TaxID=3421656 RepID=UPI003D2CA848